MLLLRHNADVNLRNSEGNQPKHVAKTRDIWELLEGKDQCMQTLYVELCSLEVNRSTCQ